MKRFIKMIFRKAGYRLERDYTYLDLVDFEPWQKEIILSVQPFTMTGVQRVAALVHTVCYLSQNRVPGAIVECGVWRGGSMMAVARCLSKLGDINRELWLYDTFEGMPPPLADDVRHDGRPAAVEFAQGDLDFCKVGLEDVRANLFDTNYPINRIHFVHGKVEDTMPSSLPGEIALLRLDTDWYSSTKHEMRHLFPLLHRDGALIIDDYGYYEGARKAVDEYFSENGVAPYLHRIDYSARLLAGAGRNRRQQGFS
ncbi:MAG: TylF/MycF/NovP-related O-methyltransferase [Methylocella sp.]